MSGQDDVDMLTTPLTPATPGVATASVASSVRRRSVRKSISLKRQTDKYKKSVVAGDSLGFHGHEIKSKKNINYQSMTFVPDESDVWRAHWTIEHYMLRGRFWNQKKFENIQTYFWIIMTGIVQAAIAFGANFSSKVFIEVSRKKGKVCAFWKGNQAFSWIGSFEMEGLSLVCVPFVNDICFFRKDEIRYGGSIS